MDELIGGVGVVFKWILLRKSIESPVVGKRALSHVVLHVLASVLLPVESVTVVWQPMI